jgi:RND family efflux transporter MFP subunit
LDPNSTTVEVWVEAANPKHELKPGSSARISMVAKTIPNAVVVPASAVLTERDGGTSVMVIAPDQHAHQQAVKVGVRQNNDAQILEGLQEGQLVATEGAYGLADGTKVTTESAREGEKPPANSVPGQDKSSKDSN